MVIGVRRHSQTRLLREDGFVFWGRPVRVHVCTAEITQKIGTIQADTRDAIEATRELSSIIKQIHDISTTIATAVEEQTATTDEILRNISGAADSGAGIAQGISAVANTAQSTSSAAATTQTAAANLARMAAELQQLVQRFQCGS